jgi:RNA polymerase sigma factor (TIGR02999 family)
MRRILVDHARAKKAARRGGDGERVQIRDFNLAAPASDDQVLALDAALEKLAELSPRQCRVVELRYFAGLTEEQVAEVLGVTRRTVCRDWLVARTWLQTQIGVRDRA